MPPLKPIFIRAMHPGAYRSEQWAKVLSVGIFDDPFRLCYHVEFVDGKDDYWVVYDEAAHYEFSTEASAR